MARTDHTLNSAADEAPPAQDAPVAHDPSELRGVLGTFATGVTVLTAHGGGAAPHGMTANLFTPVSLSPPLVLVCVLRDAAMHQAILRAQSFAISVLSTAQEPVARYFADRRRPRGDREFEVIDWSPGRRTGAPIVSGTLAWLECRLAAVYDGGDHSIFLGAVLDLGRSSQRNALLYFGGDFHRLESEQL
jgi:flavin reductase (DIM6/NTAB) family NADH-FMN oxidoreductase RutF